MRETVILNGNQKRGRGTRNPTFQVCRTLNSKPWTKDPGPRTRVSKTYELGTGTQDPEHQGSKIFNFRIHVA